MWDKLPKFKRNEQKDRSNSRHVNFLLRSIIAAYPHPDRRITPEIRLARAREALFGKKAGVGRNQIDDEFALFYMMGEELKSAIDPLRYWMTKHKDENVAEQMRAEINRAPMSRRKAADSFAHITSSGENTADGNTSERLRKKVRNYIRSSQDLADIEGLVYTNSYSAKAIDRILTDLKKFGVESNKPFGEKDG